jgi:hypothetical protein
MTNMQKKWALVFGVGFGLSVFGIAPRDARALEFSGYSWYVKDGDDFRLGPGPNRFRKENVSVDSMGRLHMSIRRDADGVWSCAEIIMRDNIGYGSYTMVLETPIDSFHPQTVLGFFTWSPRMPHAEMDIEIARFSGIDGPNLFFSVQPNALSQRISGTPWDRSEHTFVWKRGLVNFTSTALGPGSESISPMRRSIREGILQPLSTNPRLNYWLRGGTSPRGVSTRKLEVVISAVEFVRM